MNPSPNAVDQDELITSDVPILTDDKFQPTQVGGKLHCHRCGYDWRPQGETPRQCAFCKSAYWQRELPFTSPERRKAHWAKAQEKARKRRAREERAARIRRLQRIARTVGPESVDVVRKLFPKSLYWHGEEPVVVMKPLPNPLPWEKQTGMPPPPKFEDQE